MSYSEFVCEDRRLVILRVLAESPEYTSNEYVLNDALKNYGHAIGFDRLRQDLAWLAEQGLLLLRQLPEIQVVTITTRGNDVAYGRSIVPGVKRPKPSVG